MQPNKNKKFLVVLLGGSGSGKTTVENIINDQKSLYATNLVSICTRTQRPNEVNGRDYYFMNREDVIESELANFFEIADGWVYGVPKTEFYKEEDILIYSIINLEYALDLMTYCKENTDREIIIIYFNIPKEKRCTKLLERGETFDNINLRFNREDDPEWVKEHLNIDILVEDYLPYNGHGIVDELHNIIGSNYE